MRKKKKGGILFLFISQLSCTYIFFIKFIYSRRKWMFIVFFLCIWVCVQFGQRSIYISIFFIRYILFFYIFTRNTASGSNYIQSRRFILQFVECFFSLLFVVVLFILHFFLCVCICVFFRLQYFSFGFLQNSSLYWRKKVNKIFENYSIYCLGFFTEYI